MTDLLDEIEAFLERTGMAPSYFGKRVGNSDVVARLRKGADVRTRTAAKIRAFMSSHVSNDAPKVRQDNDK
jgi:hypothetical protein